MFFWRRGCKNKEGEKLIIEPSKKRSLLDLLSTLEDIDQGLLPLDDIQF